MTIGEKIRDIRMKRGLTQADLGGDLVTSSMISQIESDRTKPSYPLLTEIANRLGMPVEYFMNEMDDQFLFSAQLSIATYQAKVGNVADALAQLEKIEQTPAQGLSHQEYVLTTAQTYRKLGRYEEAIAKLEHLREIAYRTQDTRLLLHVCRESGYVEYARQNVQGALHEWVRAVDVGQQINHSDGLSSIDLTVILTDVLLQLDKITCQDPTQRITDRPYLQQARALTLETPDFRAISDKLIQDAMECVNIDAAKAKMLAERANTLLSFARLVEQVIVTQTRLGEAGAEAVSDPWEQAALATSTIYPDMFLATECGQIERLVDTGQMDKAHARLMHTRQVLHLKPQQTSPDKDLQNIYLRMDVVDAQIQASQGAHENAIAMLEQLVESFPDNADLAIQTKACAQLVLWYGAINRTDKVLHYCRLMEQQAVASIDAPPPFV